MPDASAFGENVGQTPGLDIWRIENFAPVAYDKASYGKFYSGDSYIVLNTRLSGNRLKWDIHFWLGASTSQDESGSAAIFAVELDDLLGGVPVQHREVQDHESSLFLSYFPSGVRYLDGGVASGFKHVDPDAVEKKLLQVKGKRNVRVREVPFSISSMNKGDCFVLDAGRVIYVYVGSGSKKVERLKAIQAASLVRDQDHGGKGRIIILDEYSNGADVAAFFDQLGGGGPADVAPAPEDDDDVSFEKAQQGTATLYHVSDASGSLVVEEVGHKPLQQSMLKKEDCFILDTAGSGIFVWIGRQCTKQEKVHSMSIAQKFLDEKGYPNWTKVHRVVDGGEPTLFKQYFATWKEYTGGAPLPVPVARSGRIAEFNIRSLHADKIRLLLKQGGKAPGFLPDDGTGTKEIYRVENFELEPVDPNAHGMFFGGDSYVIMYTYEKNGRQQNIVYFWQGDQSSLDEKAAAAIHAVRLDESVGGRAVQVRVTQGNEPRHFLKMFKGRMIIFSGGHASGFRNVHDYDSYDTDGTRLFHVRGTGPDDMRAVQVEEKASSLNSDDVFVLETPSNTYIWQGKGASDDEKAVSKDVAALVSPDRDPISVSEGEEPDEFWSALGGKGPYTTELPEQETLLKPRLFHCILNRFGKLSVVEIKPFKQEDLVEDDVMVLDSGHEVYVWKGNQATEQEQKEGLRMAEEYLRTEPSERSANKTLVFLVRQGEEPDSFKEIFRSWNDDMWKETKSYDEIKAQMMAATADDE